MFTMTCSCGDKMNFEGVTRDEAVAACKAMMTADVISGHMAEKHPGMPVMSVADCHAQIARDMMPA